MTDYKEVIDELIREQLLPNKEYLTINRFTRPYTNSTAFAERLEEILSLVNPVANVVYACVHVVQALWATLRAVGNFLILKPGDALGALRDSGFHLALSLALVVMAPINLLTDAVELVTRIVASWCSGPEDTSTLSHVTMRQTFSEKYKFLGTKLPSAGYLASSRFFAPYKDGSDVLKQGAISCIEVGMTGFYSLFHALCAARFALDCLYNVIIGKPQHALEAGGQLGAHLSLALALAVMTPINALVEGIAFVTRLGATAVDACEFEEFAAPATP